jgi:hypothetical protein
MKEHVMATIHLYQTTTATPEQFLAGLTDFGPGRSKLFGNWVTLPFRPPAFCLVTSRVISRTSSGSFRAI